MEILLGMSQSGKGKGGARGRPDHSQQGRGDQRGGGKGVGKGQGKGRQASVPHELNTVDRGTSLRSAPPSPAHSLLERRYNESLHSLKMRVTERNKDSESEALDHEVIESPFWDTLVKVPHGCRARGTFIYVQQYDEFLW